MCLIMNKYPKYLFIQIEKKKFNTIQAFTINYIYLNHTSNK